ncbi:Type 1 glutamine amidotransferase-like domain-containing protein [Nocardioides sp. Leaf374]|uniref:Type 1 glutamine amidotransferase-like domain-containing protein n=1 Tax=Nocardioides sp. Leaf374 TaxID=2876560 RepID=UPI001E60E562|nr:Type 1 glutamine amidotransferase-like domain-containing protein [Nocardioides sp. Leaf374]
MKLLLTSGGVTNAAIGAALVDLLPRPVEECRALLVPTAQWGHPMCGPGSVRGAVVGAAPHDQSGVSLPWASVGLLELTALPSIGPERWEPWVRDTDVLLVDGGDATYLAHWLRASGLLDVLATMPALVWVGTSAGSMVATPRIGADFVEWAGAEDDRTLGWVDVSIFPHLDHPQMPENTLAAARSWAAGLDHPSYALDDDSALVVDDGQVRVVSEGRWERLGA